MIDGKGRLMGRAFQHMRGTSGKVAEGRTIMDTEGVGRAIAVGKAANDAVEQALSKTSLAELVRGVGLNLPETVTDTDMFNLKE